MSCWLLRINALHAKRETHEKYLRYAGHAALLVSVRENLDILITEPTASYLARKHWLTSSLAMTWCAFPLPPRHTRCTNVLSYYSSFALLLISTCGRLILRNNVLLLLEMVASFQCILGGLQAVQLSSLRTFKMNQQYRRGLKAQSATQQTQ